jgi:threonine dehydratase
MAIVFVGIDLAKNVFTVRGVSEAGWPELAFSACKPVEAPVSTELADGLACRVADPGALKVILANVERIVEVTDAQVADAIRLLFSATHNVAEGAGAASLAAALSEKSKPTGQRLGLTLCGGNLDANLFARVLTGDLWPAAAI